MQKDFCWALRWAAEPGKACDEYCTNNPNVGALLGKARDQLIREVLQLAAKGDSAASRQYVVAHPQREWMVKAAAKAKHQVEEETEEAIDEYCKANRYQPVFLRFAKKIFTPRSTVSKPCDESPASVNSSSSDYSAGTTVSEPDTMTRFAGWITATFLDVVGNYLGNRRIGVDAPVNIAVTVTSKARRFDSRELIDEMENLAANIKFAGYSQTIAEARQAEDGVWEEEDDVARPAEVRKVGNATLAHDGIWDEDEEL